MRGRVLGMMVSTDGASRFRRHSTCVGVTMDLKYELEYERVQTPPEIRDYFQYMRCLGEGAQGKTYLAKDLKIDREVAIKEMKLTQTENFKDLEHFEREAQVLENLFVQGVPELYSRLSFPSGALFIVQEYIDHPSIQKILDLYDKSMNCFATDTVMRILISVAQILERLETQYTPPIVHRDIKPSNILYNGMGYAVECWLIDFGVVAHPQKRVHSSTVAGTPGFMAPEQLLGECSPASDIYALGMTAIYMLTETKPWTIPVENLHVKFEPILYEKRPNIDRDVVRLLREMTEPSVEKRIPNAKALLNHPVIESFIKNTNPKNYLPSLKGSFNALGTDYTSSMESFFLNTTSKAHDEINKAKDDPKEVGDIFSVELKVHDIFFIFFPWFMITANVLALVRIYEFSSQAVMIFLHFVLIGFDIFAVYCLVRWSKNIKKRPVIQKNRSLADSDEEIKCLKLIDGTVEKIQILAKKGAGQARGRVDAPHVIDYSYIVDEKCYAGVLCMFKTIDDYPKVGDNISVRYRPEEPGKSTASLKPRPVRTSS